MTKFCPECGTAAQGGKFCMECGTRFNDTGAASSMPAPPLMQSMQSTAINAVVTSPAVTQAAAQYAVQAMTAPSPPPPANVYERSCSTSPAMAALQAGAARASFVAASRPTPAPVMDRLQSRHSIGAAASPRLSTEGPWTPPAQRQSIPMATAIHSNTASPHKSVFSPNSYETHPPVATTPVVVPPAATGVEAQQYYEQCVSTILASKGGHNEQGVATFKTNCRLYGLQQMEVATFYASLVQELGVDATIAFVPTLARLIPDDRRRQELVEYNALQRPIARSMSYDGVGVGALASPNHLTQSRMSRSSSIGSERASVSSKGILTGRYADHPQCDICQVVFDVTKRRHQCRYCGLLICSSCSPLRLLIPPGTQFEHAKGYDVSIPQRVCIHCAPQLHSLQDELVAQYAKAHEDNSNYVSKSRIHVPFSSSLFKECQNAADIMGNFFRDDWGAAADRSIPVAFLQKAHGVALLTIVKAGFLITGQIGTGVVVAKLADGSWSAPSAIGIVGLGGGFEIGGEIIEVMIILGSAGAVKVFHKPQVNLGAGLDIAVGPYGRSAVAAASASTSGLNANYSYSLSKGLYAGISLQGTVIAARHDLNRKFYGRDLQPNEILSGHVEAPNAGRPLYEAIGYAMQGVEIHKETIARRASIMGPCRLCNCPLFVAHTHQIWNKNCKTCKHVH